MITVFIGEDDPTQALYLKKVLTKITGTPPTIFPDGLALYQAIQQERPDLIISDNILPKLDGVDIARLVKYHEKTQAIPFLMVSAIRSDLLEGFDECGADGFLSKPIKRVELAEIIETLFGPMAPPKPESEPEAE